MHFVSHWSLRYVFIWTGLKEVQRSKAENHERHIFHIPLRNNHTVSYSFFTLAAVLGKLETQRKRLERWQHASYFLQRKGHPASAKSSSALKTKCNVEESGACWQKVHNRNGSLYLARDISFPLCPGEAAVLLELGRAEMLDRFLNGHGVWVFTLSLCLLRDYAVMPGHKERER